MFNQIEFGLTATFVSVPIALILMGAFYLIKFIFQKKMNFNYFDFFSKFAWLVMLIAILFITGVLTGDYSTTSILKGNAVFNFAIFEEGFNSATILNFILFIPFGCFSVLAFRKLPKNCFYGLFIGFAFSLIIEFLQSFTGRFVEIEDLLMNSLGAMFGYLIANLLFHSKTKKYFFSKEKNIS